MAAKGDSLTQSRRVAEKVRLVPLWSVTTWDKKFNTVAKEKQKKVIKYHYFLASELEPIVEIDGTVKILTTYESDLWTVESKVKGHVSEGEVVSIPWGGNPNVQYFKGRFVTADNRIATSSDTSILNNRYLFYFMLAKKNLIGSFYRGASLKHPEMSKVLDMMIPLPSLVEQKRIAAELDKIRELKKNAEAQIENLDLLVKSRFVEMFGDIDRNPKKWPISHLGQHIDVLAGYPFDSTQYVSSGIKICGGLIIAPDGINWGECKYWPSVYGYEDYQLKAKDIVMALDRPWISTGFKIAMINAEDAPALLIQRTARIRGLDFDQEFILSLLRDKAFERHCTVTGSLVPHISHKDIESYKVITPPLALQREFAAFVEKVDKFKDVAKKSVEEMDTLYRAKLQEYFG